MTSTETAVGEPEVLFTNEDVGLEVEKGEIKDFTLPQALELAGKLMLNKHTDEAEQIYISILQNWENQPDAVHLLGVLRHLQGRNEEAIELIATAIGLMPDQPGPYNNLGNVLAREGRVDDAMESYRKAIEVGGDRPEAADAFNNLGRLHRKRGEMIEAEAACRRAIEIKPTAVDAWYNLSMILVKTGRIHDGIIANSRAVALWPRHHQPRDAVIRALVLLGELDEAVKLYREWLAEDPDNPVVKHHLAACLGEVPERASDAYVEKVFDGFANSFDKKLQSLDYCAPQLVTDALQAVAGEPEGKLDIADAGCGTGLCGPLVRPWARALVGFDLSAGMLEKAKPRQVYDVLDKAELVAYLDERPAAFDVVISADTLCYFGELEAAMRASAKALRAGGWLIYTVESVAEGDEAPYRLQTHGRYAHARAYVEASLAEANLPLVELKGVVLRNEAGKDVHGWLVTARKP
jgi:predicted TPR repeat methyltransferase